MNSASEKLRASVTELGDWFHNIDLNGVWTAPSHALGDYPTKAWRYFARIVPSDLTGRSVLDIGCNAGFYSLEMKRRGAARVLGIDWDERYLAQARFAANTLGLEIEYRKLSVYDLASLGERFDLVLFMGVLYHLRHPLLALDLIHEHAVADQMIFQTLERGSADIGAVAPDYDFEADSQFHQPDYPKLHFVEHSYAGDPTNWWIPNRACTEAMLRNAGFNLLNNPVPGVYLCRRSMPPFGSGAVYPAFGTRSRTAP